MRPATTITIAILLGLILVAFTLQILGAR